MASLSVTVGGYWLPEEGRKITVPSDALVSDVMCLCGIFEDRLLVLSAGGKRLRLGRRVASVDRTDWVLQLDLRRFNWGFSHQSMRYLLTNREGKSLEVSVDGMEFHRPLRTLPTGSALKGLAWSVSRTIGTVCAFPRGNFVLLDEFGQPVRSSGVSTSSNELVDTFSMAFEPPLSGSRFTLCLNADVCDREEYKGEHDRWQDAKWTKAVDPVLRGFLPSDLVVLCRGYDEWWAEDHLPSKPAVHSVDLASALVQEIWL